MRINRLDLIRYGRFADATIDLGPKPASGPDLHILYGPNEAGKTTIFNAVLDLLFGIETRSQYGFRHGYDQMRISASLLIDGRERTYQRVKTKQNSLLDASGAPVGDAALAGGLGGISREACRVMFSLDDRTLVEGGNSILASKGELGQLLFSASAGLADVSQELEKLERELSDFHKPNARSGGLAEAKRKLVELAEQRKAVDMQAGTHARLVEERERADDAYRQAQALLSAATAREAEVRAMQKALPLIRERDEIRVDAQALAAEPRLHSLASVVPIYTKERDDLPNRQIECAEADADVIRLLSILGRPNDIEPARLLLPAADVANLKELAGVHGALDAKHEAARLAVEEARRAVDDAASDAGPAPPAETVLRQLAAALDAVRTERASGRLQKTEQRVQHAAVRRDRCFADLAPWSGDADGLVALAAPAASDISAAATGITQAAKTRDARKIAAEKATADLARRRAELRALGEFGALLVGADHAMIRAARESSWAAHRQSLDAASAEVFEQAMRRDDAAVLAQLTQATAVARLAEARAAEAVASADDALAAGAIIAAEAELVEARTALVAMVLATSPALPGTMSGEALQDWLRRRGDALAADEEHRAATFEHAEARKDLMILRGELAAALTAADASFEEPAKLSTLEQLADALLRNAAALQERARTGLNLARALDARQHALDDAAARIAAWKSAWNAALGECWLGGLSPQPSPAATLAMLDVLAELRSALDKRTDRHDRLGKVELNMRAFAAKVMEAAASFGLETDDANPLALFTAMKERITAARTATDRLDDIQSQLAEITAEHPALDVVAPDLSMLDLELQRLAEEIASLKDSERQAFHDRETARKALAAVGGDAKVALIEAERATALTILRADSARWLRLTLGTRAVREAIRLYRDAHRGSMLDAASEAFRIISREAYRGLSAQSVNGVEELVARAADGTAKPVTELALSKGTRFQLYLALRVAGHREFARERTPPPFILDDIMETFDDFRAEEAFRLLGGMAELGQVIYLTHHRHLLPIAKEACPSARMHEIPL